MAAISPPAAHGFGTGWLLLTIALALHVADEALTGFLPEYNRVVRKIQSKISWAPLPTFTFSVWLAGLTMAVALLLSLTPFAFSGARGLRPLAYFFAILMSANGLAHIGASVYLRRFAPGVYSSPLLLLAAALLFEELAAGH